MAGEVLSGEAKATSGWAPWCWASPLRGQLRVRGQPRPAEKPGALLLSKPPRHWLLVRS